MPNGKSTKLVLDTNVLVSAFLYRKSLGVIADSINNGFIIPCFTKTTLTELNETLNDPKFCAVFEKQSLLSSELFDFISRKGFILSEPTEIPTVIKADLSDNFLLACAVACQAKYIISGDQHLLKLKQFQNIPILTPRQFLNRVNKK